MNIFLLYLEIYMPPILLFMFCIVGLYYSLKEIRECKKDEREVLSDNIKDLPKDEDPRIDVALGNKQSAKRNAIAQGLFLFISITIIWFRLQDFQGYVDRSLFRSLVIPALAAYGEYNLAMQIKSLARTRKNVKMKAQKILLKNQLMDNE